MGLNGGLRQGGVRRKAVGREAGASKKVGGSARTYPVALANARAYLVKRTLRWILACARITKYLR
jgi:hypothetical protein